MRLRPSSIDLGALAAAELTYADHGATRAAAPPGYHAVDRRDRIGRGADTFRRASAALNGWQMHRGVGSVLATTTPTAEVGSVIVMRFGPPIFGVVAPCRVVYTVDEPDRRGFAYGTLPGHPERGEEAFLVELGGDGEVYFTIRAFSRPATVLARAGGPLTRVIQKLVTDRYVRVLRRLGEQ